MRRARRLKLWVGLATLILVLGLAAIAAFCYPVGTWVVGILVLLAVAPLFGSIRVEVDSPAGFGRLRVSYLLSVAILRAEGGSVTRIRVLGIPIKRKPRRSDTRCATSDDRPSDTPHPTPDTHATTDRVRRIIQGISNLLTKGVDTWAKTCVVLHHFGTIEQACYSVYTFVRGVARGAKTTRIEVAGRVSGGLAEKAIRGVTQGVAIGRASLRYTQEETWGLRAVYAISLGRAAWLGLMLFRNFPLYGVTALKGEWQSLSTPSDKKTP